MNGDGILDAPTDFIMPADEVILYGVWQALELELIYDPNDPDATDVPSPTVWFVDCQTSVTLDEPKKTGYRLKGWAITPDATDVDYAPGDPYDMKPPVNTKFTDPLGNPYWQDVNPNVLYAVWEVAGVELQYYSYTDAFPDGDAEGNPVLVKSVFVQLTDFFDYTYDPNKDDDPTNDYLSMKVIGWYNWPNYEDYYTADWQLDHDGNEPTIQDLADIVGWNGTGPLMVVSELELRQITVTYSGGGYEEQNDFEDTRTFYWTESPYLDLIWLGAELEGQYDEEFNSFDSSMTCGDILINLGPDYWVRDDMIVFVEWIPYNYEIIFNYPNGLVESVATNYTSQINLPTSGAGFDYPGYTFVGWFTEPDGAGIEVADLTRYSALEPSDKVFSRDLYAYFVPDGTAISVESMDEDAGIQASSVIVPEMNVAAAAPRSAAPKKAASLVATAAKPEMLPEPEASFQACSSLVQGPALQAAANTMAAASMDALSFNASDALFAAGCGDDDASLRTFIVNYYKDSIAEDNFIISIEGEGEIGSEIPYTDEYAPEGYEPQAQLEGAFQVTQNAAENVLNVIYQQCFDVGYTVNYYRGSICEDNLITEEVGEALPYGTVVDLPAEALNCQCPKGYAPLEQGRSFKLHHDPARNVMNVIFHPNFDEFYAAGIAPLRVFYDGLDHVVAPKGVMAGDTVTYFCDGATQTRVVDEGEDYGMAFSKATQGEVPLVVTLTRAGVTSNAIQTLVNIIPQVQEVFVPGDGGEQGTQASKPSGTKPRPSAPALSLAASAVAKWVNPTIAVPTPSYSAEMAAEAREESGAAEVSSSSDANPLAATPLLNKKRAKQGSGIPDAALLIPATLFAAAAGVLLVLRKRCVGAASGLKGSALAAERAKATKMSRFAILSAAAAAAFYLLWVLL